MHPDKPAIAVIEMKKSIPRFRECSTINFIRILNYLHIYCIRTFAALFNLELYRVVVTDGIDEAGRMNKDLFSTVAWSDEAKTLCLIKKFYCSLLHDIDIKMSAKII
jgi:hypothetical protein